LDMSATERQHQSQIQIFPQYLLQGTIMDAFERMSLDRTTGFVNLWVVARPRLVCCELERGRLSGASFISSTKRAMSACLAQMRLPTASAMVGFQSNPEDIYHTEFSQFDPRWANTQTALAFSPVLGRFFLRADVGGPRAKFPGRHTRAPTKSPAQRIANQISATHSCKTAPGNET